MRIRLVKRGNGEFQVMAEQESKKGKKVTSGKVVKKDGIRAEVQRLMDEVKGNEPQG